MVATVILSEQFLEGFTLNSFYGIYALDVNPAPFSPKLGETYYVMWDGTIYKVDVQDASILQEGALFLGNGTGYELDGKGEPFAIGWSPYGITYFAREDTESKTHRVALYLEVSEDTFPETVLNFQYDENFGAYAVHGVGSQIFLVEGETYQVLWDGSKFTCEAWAAQQGGILAYALGNPIAIGGEDNEMPFIIACAAEHGGTSVFTFNEGEVHTLGIIQGEERAVIVRDYAGRDVPYTGVEQIALNTNEGDQQLFTKGELLKGISAEVDFSAGDMHIQLPEGYLAKEATIKKPDNLIPGNIKKGEVIAGIEGDLVGNPEEVTVELDFTNGDHEVTPSSEDKLISKAIIKKPGTLIPEYIAEDIDIAGVVGTFKGGGGTQFEDYIAGRISVLNNPQVVEVASRIFTSNPFLTSVAFAECSKVGSYAFNYCSSLQSVYLPECTTLDGYAFSACYKLSDVYLPKCTNVGPAAFAYCSSLTEIPVSNLSYAPVNFCLGCTGLTSVHMDNAAYVGHSAFYGCIKITEISFPLATRVYSSAFRGCTSLQNVHLPVCTSIDGYAFQNCTSLSSISLNEVTAIYDGVFAGCSKLNTVIAPKVSTLGQYAFSGCTALESLSVPLCKTTYTNTFSGCTNLKTLAIGLSYVYSSTFYSLRNLETLYLSSVSLVSTYAFSSMSKLQCVYLNNHGYKAPLGSRAFQSACSGLVLRVYGEAAASTDAFAYCSAKRIENHLGGTQYGGVFRSCRALDILYAKFSPWTSTFMYCTSLKRCESPFGNCVGTTCFYGCSNLQFVKLNAASYISNQAFYNCSKLSVIYFTGIHTGLSSIGTNAFYNTPMITSTLLGYYGSIYVPSSLVTQYQAMSAWASLSSRITAVTDEIKALFEGEIS